MVKGDKISLRTYPVKEVQIKGKRKLDPKKAKLTLSGIDPRPVYDVAALSVRLHVEVELHHEHTAVGAQVRAPDGGRWGRDGQALHWEVDFSARGRKESVVYEYILLFMIHLYL